MTVSIRHPITRLLTDAELGCWEDIPTAILSDELNREAGLSSAIAPISQIARFVGEALTVNVMVGDNLALHVAVNAAPRGAAIVVNAGGCLTTAVWGEVLHAVATYRGVTGVVIDGAVRDRESLRRSGVPIFARGSTPNGPHKGWGGTINGSVQCGGVSVVPGDLIVGDADGVVAVPRAKLPGLLERCRGRIDREAGFLRQIAAGGQTTEILGLSAAVEREYEGA
jgi:4-hydroxy-4-methyl-2-oxoglutarate aldolase